MAKLFAALIGNVIGKWILRKAAPAMPAATEPKPVTVPESIPTTAAEAAPEEVISMSIASLASGFLAKAQAVASLLPILSSLVQLVEASLPAGTPGAAKLKAVEDALASVYAKEQIASASFNEIWPLLAGVAGSLVASFKATGLFTSSKQVAPAVDPAPVA